VIINVKAKSGVCHKKLLIIFSILLVVLLSSLVVYKVTVVDDVFSSDGSVQVETEKALKTAIDNIPLNTSTLVVLSRDIALTETLIIPDNKNITLTSNKANGFYKLIGVSLENTITIETNGKLQLDGVIVTHVAESLGRSGVYVNTNGTLILSKGEISGNTDKGVYNLGTFTMSGGIISNNTATYGGGVTNMGTFSMSGGKIIDNRSDDFGGGVQNYGVFNMLGGEISNNTAIPWHPLKFAGVGGGVSNSGVFTMSGGIISNNTAKLGANDISSGKNFTWTGGTITDETK
jgi:hypothetical protein